MLGELRALLRFVAIVAVVVVGLLALYRLLFRRRAAGGAAGKLATEVRCDRHGVRVRIEADTQAALDRARFHAQCPLCALDSARDVS